MTGIRSILIVVALAVTPCLAAAPGAVAAPGLVSETGAATELPARPRAVLNQQRIPEADISVIVRDVASGETLVNVNGELARPPASTMKILPTWAALDLLGPAYTWKTRALADAPVVKGVLKGNLYLQGGGDPLLTIERWWRFVADLRQTGLRVIEGDIVIDQTRFAAPDERPEDFDGKFWRTYNVLPDAMLVNWQSSDFTIRPSDDGEGIEISIQPFPEGLVVDNRVTLANGRCVGRNRRVGYTIAPTDPGRVVATGRLAASCAPQTQRLAIMEPAQYAWGTFVTLCDAHGDAAVELALDQHRIDHVADVVDRVIAHDLDRAGRLVDLDFDDMAAVRIGALAAVVSAALEDAGFHAGRQRLEVERALGDFGDVDGLVGAGDRELALLEHDVVLGGFERVRRELG